MHDGMQYDPIQYHVPLKVGNLAIIKGYLFPRLQLHCKWGWQMTTDS